jgi:Cu-Zn family superoxide dismutase
MNRKMGIAALFRALFLLSYIDDADAQNRARADIKDSGGKNVGTASLRETKEGVLITLNVKGLPQGLRAIHVHSVGKCEGLDFKSAGGHFNPLKKSTA